MPTPDTTKNRPHYPNLLGEPSIYAAWWGVGVILLYAAHQQIGRVLDAKYGKNLRGKQLRQMAFQAVSGAAWLFVRVAGGGSSL